MENTNIIDIDRALRIRFVKNSNTVYDNINPFQRVSDMGHTLSQFRFIRDWALFVNEFNGFELSFQGTRYRCFIIQYINYSKTLDRRNILSWENFSLM